MDFATAAALNLTLFLISAFVVYRMVRIEIRATQDDLENMRGQMTLMRKKVDAVVQSHNGARIMAESAIIHAQNAEALAKVARREAARPIVLVGSPANDDTLEADKIKKQ